MATRKLLHYFIDHEVTVVTSYPLGDIIRNRDAAGRISKWAHELMGHDIRYSPRTAIKSQALADFVAEWTEVQLPTPDVTLEPGAITDPSKYIVQYSWVTSGVGSWISVHSTTKSMRA